MVMNKFIRLILVLVIVSFCYSTIQAEIIRSIPAGSMNAAVLIRDNNSYIGSGFFMLVDQKAFFVTARHVLLQDKDNEFIPRMKAVTLISYSLKGTRSTPMELSLELDKLYKEKCVKYDSLRDIVIVQVGEEVSSKEQDGSNKIELIKGVSVSERAKGLHFVFIGIGEIMKFKDVAIGSDAYIFGFPVSIGDPQIKLQIEYDKPLLRKGAIAGKNEKLQTIILDCPAYGGNSGSLVIQVNDYFEK